MASFNIVELNLEFLQTMVRDYVDIVFANEEESKAFTRKAPEDALDEISKMCEIAVVKVGARGSMVKKADEKIFVEAIKANPIDTTGAGDLYASGFLYGLIHDYSLSTCAELGSLLGGNVIEVVGPKMVATRWADIRSKVAQIAT
jgi:sugar/nucleoside kinase (ribokinase family)